MRNWWSLVYSTIRLSYAAVAVLFFLCIPAVTHAATIYEYRDTISNSAPSEYSNHTIEFKTSVAIPTGGFIRFTPADGEFTIPASDFDFKNVEISVATFSGYVVRAATSTPSATEDGVTIIPGSSGSIEVTLNNTVSIPANAQVRMRIGDNTTNATTSDLGILNPSATGTVSYTIEAGSSGNSSQVRGLIALLEHVGVGPLDTTEFIPPVRFNGAPTGTLSGTAVIVQVSLETNEFARCRYSMTSGTLYFAMGNEFSSRFTTIHSKNIAVATSTSYTLYVRCIDDEENENEDDYSISFTVPAFPEGIPGDRGDDEGQGSGGGTGAGGSGGGTGAGGGSGSSGSGSGGGSGGGGGSGAGPSSGGSGGGGGFEGTQKAYQSGDGRVVITGYAFPRSTVYILVDGVVTDTVVASGDGEFSVTIDAIARGVYTFGIYAIDQNKVRSSTFSTTFTVTGARASTLSNINVMPSIKVTPNPVDPGQTLTISGYALPSAVITIENQQDKSSASLKTFTANSDTNGAWSLTLDTTGFQKGTYKVRAKAKQEGGTLVQTNFSGYTFYGVGEAIAQARSSDLNRDGKVNLIDFSILLFWWNTAGGNSNPPADINGDGKVSLTDFSIMIFNWTG